MKAEHSTIDKNADNHSGKETPAVELALKVTGMSCQGCVSNVRKLIQQSAPEAIVTGVPKENTLLVTSDLSLASIEAIVEEAGYQSFGLLDNSEHAQSGADHYANETLSDPDSRVEPSEVEVNYQLSITGMTCAGCVNSVQKALVNADKVMSAEVNFANHTAQVTTLGSLNVLIKAVADAGYQASLIVDTEKNDSEREKRELKEYHYKRQSAALGLALGVPLMLYGILGGSMAVSTLTDRLIWLFIGIVTLWIMVRAGKHYFRGAWKAFTSHQANMDMLIALGTGCAWFYSMLVVIVPSWLPENTHHLYFEASVMIIGLINLGQALELRARRKTSQALHRLLDLRPKMATRIENSVESRVPVADIKLGDVLRVRSGDSVPVDGEVLEGLSTVNESMLTGEAVPIEKHQGSLLSAGTVNGQGSLLFKATRIGSDTLLAQIITMVSKAQGSKPPISVLADKVSSVFVPSVIIVAILSALAWFNFGGEAVFSYMLVTSISVLIIACPCALGLATPISTMIGIGKAAEYGGLIRNGDALQRASELTVVVLDKTGTITEGKPKVVNQTVTEHAQEGFVAQLVSVLEARANHPLADALLEYCQADVEEKDALKLEGFESLVGLGVKGHVNGKEYYLGNERLMKEKGIHFKVGNTDNQHSAATRVYLSDEKVLLAVFYIEDPIKKGMKAAIASFKKQGLKVVMLTGDNPETAASVASEVGIEDYHAQLMPDDKLNWVKKLQAQGEVVGMIGDGINDAPALAQADVGFAMGAGTDVAMESADITLINNDLKGVADVIQISKATLRNIKQNLWGAFAYNTLGIPVAAGILFPFTGWLLSPVIAGAAMSLSSVTVVTNANRLRLFRVSRDAKQEVEN
ncbi:cadmium-translocating P-type ATPase [Marinomonas sp. M1K-6]|uniref:Copper-exporting P-type ATPase n=1 Tax=Marinomonas profundi TaxID=2726122 RepID=A0A847R2B2_9GAMM|nr:copper-translocating P-type ATPase [Marinomonas profundi]NLQ16423.1 cadmium-translocating P-type ATPase [Marinomonas profundi]UDV03004.1 cadmium-translocating P-type ATPase [Marinomonas profundi]